MHFAPIVNVKEMQEEKGMYYPYLMQLLGCPVIEGKLISEPTIGYMYSHQVEWLFDCLVRICIPHIDSDNIDYSDKIFKSISRFEFEKSIIYTLSDCFFEGCDLEDVDEDKMFDFLYNGEWKDILVN